MEDLYLISVTTAAGTSHHSVPGTQLTLVAEQLTQTAALLGQPPPQVNVHPLHTTHPTMALPGMAAVTAQAERHGLLSSSSHGYVHNGQHLSPEQLIKANATRQTAVHENPDMDAQMTARQILGDTLRLMKLSISEQTRRYVELNTQREQISNHITTTYQPN